jgi:hypothetical protein
MINRVKGNVKLPAAMDLQEKIKMLHNSLIESATIIRQQGQEGV